MKAEKHEVVIETLKLVLNPQEVRDLRDILELIQTWDFHDNHQLRFRDQVVSFLEAFLREGGH